MNCKNLENKFYICELCNKQYCINCMYLYCSECKIYCFCFWCGRKKMDTENTESVYTSQKNMRSCKVGFFTKDIEKFKNELVDMPYFFYKCTYKYSSDNDGVLDWIASNLNQAFANEIDTSDDIKNRVFCVFRCYQPNKNIKKYEYLNSFK